MKIFSARIPDNNQLYQFEDLFLHPQEKEYCSQFLTQQRKQEFLAGRFAAKSAIRKALAANLPFNQLLIKRSKQNAPILASTHQLLAITNLSQELIGSVSISHTNLRSYAIFSPNNKVGIDCELQSQKIKPSVINRIASKQEYTCIENTYSQINPSLVAWTVKESCSKLIGLGLNQALSNSVIIGKIQQSLQIKINSEKNLSCWSITVIDQKHVVTIASEVHSDLETIEIENLIYDRH